MNLQPLAIPGIIGIVVTIVGAWLSTERESQKKKIRLGYVLLFIGLVVLAGTLVAGMMSISSISTQ